MKYKKKKKEWILLLLSQFSHTTDNLFSFLCNNFLFSSSSSSCLLSFRNSFVVIVFPAFFGSSFPFYNSILFCVLFENDFRDEWKSRENKRERWDKERRPSSLDELRPEYLDKNMLSLNISSFGRRGIFDHRWTSWVESESLSLWLFGRTYNKARWIV